jgi:hypothetical protein
VPRVNDSPDEVPFLPWDDFLRQFVWKQGEHVAAIAATQSGKTTLLRAIMHRRRYVVMLATKNKDRVMDGFTEDGFVTQKEWLPIPEAWPRVILKPGLKNSDDKPNQKAAFKACLDNVFRAGGWTVFADEVRYVTQNLKLAEEMELLWLQASSHDATLVGATQRPAWVPLEFYNASTHIFLWGESDTRNLKRISELDGANTDLIQYWLTRLRQYECLYVCTRKDANGDQMMVRTKAPKGR